MTDEQIDEVITAVYAEERAPDALATALMAEATPATRGGWFFKALVVTAVAATLALAVSQTGARVDSAAPPSVPAAPAAQVLTIDMKVWGLGDPDAYEALSEQPIGQKIAHFHPVKADYAPPHGAELRLAPTVVTEVGVTAKFSATLEDGTTFGVGVQSRTDSDGHLVLEWAVTRAWTGDNDTPLELTLNTAPLVMDGGTGRYAFFFDTLDPADRNRYEPVLFVFEI